MDRTFSSWRHGCPVENVTTIDLKRLETSIIATLRRAAGYPEPDKEGGEFDPNKMTSTYLNKLDTNQKVKIIANMAGLLWYRSLPLARLSTKHLEKKKERNEEVDFHVLEDLKTTRDRLDATKDELLERDRKIIALQDEVSALKDTIISMKDSLLETSVNAVQAVVKEEIQSYSSVLESAATAVKESCVSALAPSKIRTAIVSASEDRSTNLIVYGLPESSDSTDRDSIKDLFQHLDEALVMSKVERLGRSGEQVRPIRVVMRTREAARTILGKSARLKDSDLYQRVYIAPDRTFEERSERRALVARLRQMRDHEPEKVWRIRRGSIVENECERESERESEREEGESEGEGESERERESQRVGGRV